VATHPFGHGVAWPPPFGRFGGGQQPHGQMEVAETTSSGVAHPLAMGFPAFSVMNPSGERALSKPNTIDEVLWKGIHEKLYLYESYVEDFVLDNTNLYDMIFIDAYELRR
jgi:hypothetical protein